MSRADGDGKIGVAGNVDRHAQPGRLTKTISPQIAGAADALLAALDQLGEESIVIFLGAGVSNTYRYPLARELMLQILNALASNQILQQSRTDVAGLVRTHGDDLHDFLVRLLPGEHRARQTMPLVTGVLSLLDYSLATGQVLLKETTLEETRRMRFLLERALLKMIPDPMAWDENDPEEEQQKATSIKPGRGSIGCASARAGKSPS